MRMQVYKILSVDVTLSVIFLFLIVKYSVYKLYNYHIYKIHNITKIIFLYDSISKVNKKENPEQMPGLLLLLKLTTSY